jgi:glycosyltransferase involved in cell wall biosynthesis
VVSGDDVSGIAEAFESVASLTHQQRLEIGLRGRKHAEENYAYEALGRRFSDVLLALMD